VNAVEARRNTEVRGRVALAVRTSSRTIADLLNGYEGQPTLARKIRAALEAEGVDLATIPARTPAEVLAWKRERQPLLKNKLPEGYALETCKCGREYPRAVQAAEDFCWKCRWKREEKLARELAVSRAELMAETPERKRA
jgi:hypothetical protein